MGRTLVALILLAVTAAAQPPGPSWREAPEFLALFAPPGPRASAYRAYVSPQGLDAVLKAVRDDPATLQPPGAWVSRALLPGDAFGQTGAYDRFAVARLYGARRANVARGPRVENGRVTESWTLVSPYPDPALRRLEPGTLLIVLRLP